MSDLLKNYTLGKWLRITVSNHFPECVEKNGKFNFRCRVCGDSKKSKSKKRGWISQYKGTWIFKCWNCGASDLASNWLKKNFPQNYQNYIQEVGYVSFSGKPVEEEAKKVVDVPIEKKIDENLAFFAPLFPLSNRINYDAVEFCKKRKIPKEVYSTWFVCSKGKYKDRLIIPFYDTKKNLYYYQGRALYGNEIKYLNKEGSRDVIYNYFQADKTKPVIVLEGVIDSLFVENSISVLSTNWSDEIQKVLDRLECYYLLDLDSSKETKKRCRSLLEKERYVFNWQKFLYANNIPMRSKWDINELVLFDEKWKNLKFEQIEKYFTNNFFQMGWFI